MKASTRATLAQVADQARALADDMNAFADARQKRPAPADDMALPPGKSCADCRGFERCVAFIGEKHINDKATRCDWSPSAFAQRDAAPDARRQIGPTDI